MSDLLNKHTAHRHDADEYLQVQSQLAEAMKLLLIRLSDVDQLEVAVAEYHELRDYDYTGDS